MGIFLVLSAMFVSSLTKEELWEQVQGFKGQKVFSPLDKFYSDEVVNIRFIDTDEKIYAVVEDGTLTQIEQGENEDPTMVVEINTFETINLILNADDPAQAFTDQKDLGNITFKPVGFFKKAKYYLAIAALKVYGWF